MSQNLVIPNKDNKVVLVFGGIDLTQSTNIIIEFGAETYSTALNPTLVIIESSTELSLDLSSTAEVGRVFAKVTYVDGGSVNGTDITSRELGNLDQIIVAVGTQLVIEDGSIVDNANSFAADSEFKSYADLRGFSIPSTQPERESLLILAMDYIFSVESKMQGHRVDKAQALPYPRYGVCANNFDVASNSIPPDLKMAQIELAVQAGESDILISEQSQSLASFSVDGVYSESYFSGGSWTQVRTDRADAYLNKFLVNGGSTNKLTRF